MTIVLIEGTEAMNKWDWSLCISLLLSCMVVLISLWKDWDVLRIGVQVLSIFLYLMLWRRIKRGEKMPDDKALYIDTPVVVEDFDYVKYMVGSWRAWIASTMAELDKVEMKEIKLIVYFSIIEMMAQEYYEYPLGKEKETFTKFVLEFQDKYDYLEMTDPVSLYYHVEKILSSSVTLDDLVDGEIYHPKTAVIRNKVEEIGKVLESEKDKDFSDTKMKQHRYVDLLYRMRCRLSHEFSAPRMSFTDRETPYYIKCARQFVTLEGLKLDDVWHLAYPLGFIKELCLNCFENYLDYCLKERRLPNQNNGLDRLCELSWYNR